MQRAELRDRRVAGSVAFRDQDLQLAAMRVLAEDDSAAAANAGARPASRGTVILRLPRSSLSGESDISERG